MPTLFRLTTLEDEIFKKIIDIVNVDVEKKLVPAHTKGGYQPHARNCKSFNILGPQLNDILFPIVQEINLKEKWNFKLVEPNNYVYNSYEDGNFYIWHTDGNLNDKPQYVRKVSFSLCLSDDYSGGDFLIQSQRTTDFTKMPYQRFHLKEKEMIVFKSDVKHKVETVTAGKRDTIVGWIYGPKSWNL